MTNPKRRDMTGTVRCSVCKVGGVHERGPGSPLIIRHADDCPERPDPEPTPRRADGGPRRAFEYSESERRDIRDAGRGHLLG
jgi:hypothetical protein